MYLFPQLNLPADLAVELKTVFKDLHQLTPVDSRPWVPEPISTGKGLPKSAPKFLSLQGWPQAGKDVVADYLIEHYGGVGRMAFSDAIIREINSYLLGSGHEIGPDNKSHAVYRKLMQVWARARRVENPHYWSEPVQEGLRLLKAQGAELAIATGMRTELERDAILALDMGEVWRVIRPQNPYNSDDPIEHALDHIPNHLWHAVIFNDVENNLAAYENVIENVIHSPARGFCDQVSLANTWYASHTLKGTK